MCISMKFFNILLNSQKSKKVLNIIFTLKNFKKAKYTVYAYINKKIP